ncbi:aminopeptidase N [Phytohabitans kaempferiae]|uniref:Aminopeptidase N n=1 Tax=Phytohabitans kaempferiae TaxID=1620943 RepID=A0ABV6M792_9ACTN
MSGTTLARGEALMRSRLIQVESYRVKVDLTQGEELFHSHTEIEFSATDGAGTFIDLMPDELLRVKLNGQTIDVDSPVDGGRLWLDKLQPRNLLVVDGMFAYSRGGEGLKRTVDPSDGSVYVESMAFMAGARRMFAAFDQPDLKAQFTIEVVAPAEWVVISNEEETDRQGADAGTVLVRFAPTPRIPTYVVALLAGPFVGTRRIVETARGRVPLGVYTTSSNSPRLDAEAVLDLAYRGMTTLESLFATPFPFSKYDQVFGTGRGIGGMENAGAVLLGSGLLPEGSDSADQVAEREYVVLHELAHMWFGDFLTPAWWDDSWLNEAFATFLSHIVRARLGKPEEVWARFALYRKASALEADQLPDPHPIAPDHVPDLLVAAANFDVITYRKGAAVLRQLSVLVGEEHFFSAVRALLARHPFGTVTRAKFMTALEEQAGVALGTWAERWLRSPGVDVLAAAVDVDDDGRYRTVELRRAQSTALAEPRPHRVGVGLYTDTGGRLRRTSRAHVTLIGDHVEIPEFAGLPAADLVLIDDEDLAYARTLLDEEARDTLLAGLGRIDDPIALAVAARALKDATRNSEIPASRYVESALHALAANPPAAVQACLLEGVKHAIVEWAAPGNIPDLLDALVHSLPPQYGSMETQRAWLSTIARLATDTGNVGLLDVLAATSADAIVDRQVRWLIVQARSACGAIGREVIDAEFDAAPDPASAAEAATARALIPTAAAKAAAWTSALRADGIDPESRRGVITGFWSPRRTDLLGSYVARYFAALNEIWALDEGGPVATMATSGLFPRLPLPVVVELARKEAARPRPATQRRIIIEHAAALECAIGNRRVDAKASHKRPRPDPHHGRRPQQENSILKGRSCNAQQE